MAFLWKGGSVDTVGDVASIVIGIVHRDDEKEAEEFLSAYRKHSEHADSNIGYLLGYLGQDDMIKGLRLFNVRHPVFGGAPEAAEVTTEQAFEMGKQLGAKMREQHDQGGR